MVTLALTTKCNNNCIMCVYNTEKMSKIAGFSIENEIKKISEENDSVIALSGGEPLMSRHLIMALEMSLKNSKEVLLLTNGRLLYYPEVCNQILKINQPNLKICIPLLGSSPVIHDSVTRAPGSFIQTKKGIQNVLERQIRTEIRIIITSHNINDLPDISRIIINEMQKIENVVFIHPLIRGNAKKNIAVIPLYEENKEKLEESLDLLDKKGIQTKLYHIPFCKISKKHWNKIYSSLGAEETKKLPLCSSCLKNSECPGIPKEYLEEKGTEIEPVK